MKKIIPILLVPIFFHGCKEAPSTLSQSNEKKIIAPDQFQPSQRRVKQEGYSEVAYQINLHKQKVLDNPSDKRAHLVLATYYHRMGKMQQAIKHFEHADLVEPLEESKKLLLAQLYAQNNQLDKALNIYNIYTKKYPTSWKLKNDIANVYRKQQQYQKALDIVEQLLREKKDNIFAIHTLANIYADQKKYDLAELTLHRARKLNPKNAETWNQLGVTYVHIGYREEAQKSFLAATSRNPQLIQPKMNLAQSYIDHHDYNNAAKLYKDILSIEPLELTAIYHLGVSSAALGLDDAANESFIGMVKIDPQNAKAMYALGILNQYHMQDGQKAVQYYNRFIALSPGLSKQHEVFTHLKKKKKMPPKVD
ncbi:MAG: tetratricopeptide repeat protein, partial [Deltaproteobacteria bacterium]|nr:tetratricopeptide repeat protein [Deltaproteobacteria bacterium]